MIPSQSRVLVESARSADQWNSVLQSSFGASVRRVSSKQGFAAQLRMIEAGDGLLIADVESTGAKIHHSPNTKVGRAPEFVLHIQVLGTSRTIQNGLEIVTAERQATVINTAKPYVLEFDDPTRIMVVRFPPLRLLADGFRLREQAMLPFAAHPAVLSLAVSVIESIWHAAMFDGVHNLEAEVTDTLLALISLAQSNAGSTSLNGSHEMASWLQVQKLIESNLDNPELGGLFIAKCLSRSQRYVQKLFRARGVTVTDTIREKRLELAAQCLASPAHAHRSVTEVCFDCGFSDLSYFSQTFKQHFGVSPGSFRTAQLQ